MSDHVLVTGGAGFIGTHLVRRLLEEGHRVRVLDYLLQQVHGHGPIDLPADVEFIGGNVNNGRDVEEALEGITKLVHLAARVGVGQSMYDICSYTYGNTMGAATILEEAIRQRGILEKMVVASSMSIYGEGAYACEDHGEIQDASRRPGDLAERSWEPRCELCGEEIFPIPTPESKPLAPASIYAINKRDAEEMFLVVGRVYEIPATALRFFNVYGPGQALSNPYTGVVAIFAGQLLNGHAPQIFEDGLQSRDFVHVRDVVAGIMAALEPGRSDGLAINLGAGANPPDVLMVAHTLAKLLDVDVEPQVLGQYRAGDIRHCYADISRATLTLDYHPKVAFVDGMAELVAWLANQEATDRVGAATQQLVERGLVK